MKRCSRPEAPSLWLQLAPGLLAGALVAAACSSGDAAEGPSDDGGSGGKKTSGKAGTTAAGAGGSGAQGGASPGGQGGTTPAGQGGTAQGGAAQAGGSAQGGQGGSGAGQAGASASGQGGASAGQSGSGGSAQAGQGGSVQAGQGGSGGSGQAGSDPGGEGQAGTSPGLSITCAQLAQQSGWDKGTYTCDVDGSKGWCAGQGQKTLDCVSCCGPSCGILAGAYGEPNALCDDGKNGACAKKGVVTWDCSNGCCGGKIPTSDPGTGGAGGGPPTGSTGFGYPLGDKSTYPGGGAPWGVWQVLGHYWGTYVGVHLAEDVGGGPAFSPIYAVADGDVVTSSPNSSSYKNVIAIKHTLNGGAKVCSVYGHLDSRKVQKGEHVSRGQEIATLMDQGSNTHLHYAIVPEDFCDHIAGLSGGGFCGYDGAPSGTNPQVGHNDLADEPASYTAQGTNVNGCSAAGYQVYAPSQFIKANHF